MTTTSLMAYIEAYRRIHGTLPKLRECVEHFDGKLLHVLMCLGELTADAKDELRRYRRPRRSGGDA
jgi:hypothetical protein